VISGWEKNLFFEKINIIEKNFYNIEKIFIYIENKLSIKRRIIVSTQNNYKLL